MGKYVVLALVCSISLIARAVADSKQLDIPAGALVPALEALSKQAAVEIVYQPDLLRGLYTRGVEGTYEPQDAVRILLKGTPLELRIDSSGAMAIISSHANTGTAVQPSPSPAAATYDEQQPRFEQLPTVIVTANKRSENIQDVPFSITAITANYINRRGLVGEADYLRGIPGANQVENPNGGTVVIRGIDTGPEYQNYYLGPTVATYFGEAQTTASAGINVNANIDLKLVDIERVEVLRGPQGTAFGDAALAGAVRTIPVAPELDSLEGTFTAGYSNTSGPGAGNYTIQGVTNIPLVEDRLAIRAVGYVFSDTGYYTDIVSSDAGFQAALVKPFGVQAFATDKQNVGSTYVSGARVAALFKASDDLRFTLSYLTQTLEQNGWGAANSGIYYQSALQVSPGQIVRGQTAGMNDQHIKLAIALMEYDLKWADLIAAYTQTSSGTSYVMPDSLYGVAVQSDPASQRWDSSHRENVGEIRLVSKLDGEWSYIAGLYSEEASDNTTDAYDWVGNSSLDFYEPGVTEFSAGYDYRTLRQQAAFGEVSWKFLPQFTLTAGARTFRYHRTYVANSVGAFATSPPDTGESMNRTGSIYRANLAYRPGDKMLLYAEFGQGFRLGRPQPAISAELCDPNHTGFIQGTDIPIASTASVSDDSLNNYELGTKLSALDGRLVIDADVFHMIWKNIPVTLLPASTAPNCFPSFIANAGRAKSNGAEAQLSFQVTTRLRVDIGGSYIDARLTQDTPDAGLSSGMRLPSAPSVNTNLGLQYDYLIAGHAASLRADAIYVGSYFVNIHEQPNTEAGDYVKLDASARVSLGDKVNLDLYVHNATNSQAFVMRSGYAFGTSYFGYRLRPRTVGIQLSYGF